MVLKAYFDAGNKADSIRYDVLTLAMVCHVDADWKSVERSWDRNLRKHRAPFLHTTDLMSFQGAYVEWDKPRKDSFLRDCVRIIGKNIARKNHESEPGRYGMLPYTVSIVLKDFIAARKQRTDLTEDANEICFRQALTAGLAWCRDNAHAEFMHLIFDQGEPFFGFACNLLDGSRPKRDSPELGRIKSRTQGDAEFIIPLQIADLFAWCVSHKNQPDKANWHRRLLQMDRQDEWLDEPTLITAVLADQAPWKNWKIPRRKATK